MKAIYFDMDGTIADLYNYPNWLQELKNESVLPYKECAALVDMKELKKLLNEIYSLGITIGIISWGAMNGKTSYTKEVKKAKIEWLKKQGLNELITEIHVTKYGTPKHQVRKIADAVLIDDAENVRQKWKGKTIDASSPDNIFHFLNEVIEKAA